MELLIALNPDPDSRLPYLMRFPLAGGMVFRTSGTWPRTRAFYCHTAPADEWPADPNIVEQVRLRSCVGWGAPAAPGPATAEVRAWASAQGITVPSRGKLGTEIWDAWRAAHDGNQDPDAASSPQAG